MFLYKPTVTPSLSLFCHPEPTGEGSLGAYTPRDDIPEDAVPIEVRDASLSLGTTE